MKTQGPIRLFAFISLLVLVSLACGGGSSTPAPAPVQQEPVQQEPQQQPVETASNSGGLVTFTDQNDYFAIDVPGDWTYAQTVDEDGNDYYIDTFTAPDELALVESIVYDDGTAFSGNQKATFALYLLNTFYSNTGQEGDIRVSEDQIMDDGSERLIWTSRGGEYSGISFLETRGSTTFLFFTVEWVNSAEDQYLDTLNAVIESYHIP
jgi:hypothetical protein